MTKKTLPSISAPTVVCVLPLSKKTVKFRPFIVKEQKALMLAQSSNDIETINATLADVILSCTFGAIDMNEIPSADLAYFFVQLRIQSVGPEVRFSVPCSNCGESVIINFSLDSIKVDVSDYKDVVMVTEDVGITFKVPSIKDAIGFDKNDMNTVLGLLYNIMVNVFDREQIYDKSDYTKEDFISWLDTFTDDQLEKIYSWVQTIPELKHELDFTCNHCQTKNSRQLAGLHSFFRPGIGTRVLGKLLPT